MPDVDGCLSVTVVWASVVPLCVVAVVCIVAVVLDTSGVTISIQVKEKIIENKIILECKKT